MKTEELIEVAKECGTENKTPYGEDTYYVFNPISIQQFAQRIEQAHLQKIEQLREALKEMKQAMVDYEWGVDLEAPKKHRDMMRKVDKALEQTK